MSGQTNKRMMGDGVFYRAAFYIGSSGVRAAAVHGFCRYFEYVDEQRCLFELFEPLKTFRFVPPERDVFDEDLVFEQF